MLADQNAQAKIGPFGAFKLFHFAKTLGNRKRCTFDIDGICVIRTSLFRTCQQIIDAIKCHVGLGHGSSLFSELFILTL